MANRYWVGGTSSWNGTAGTKRATTSGGTGGAAEPTSADDVFFDNNSGSGTVTIATSTANCLSLDFTGFTGTFAGSVGINIAGNLTLATGMTRTYTGAITFTSTSTGKTITLHGKTTASSVSFNGSGGGRTLQDNWDNGSSNIVFTNGTFDSNGKTINCGQFGTATGTKTVTLGASTINCGQVNFSPTNLTLNSGTSTVNIGNTGSSSNLGSSAQTWYNITVNGGVSFSPTSSINNLDFTSFFGSTINANSYTIRGNLTLSPFMTYSATGTITFTGTGSQTITSNGTSMTAPLTFNASGGTRTLQDDLVTTGALTVTQGTFNANNYNVTVNAVSSSNTNVRTITMGSGTWTLTRTSIGPCWNTSTKTNLTLNANTSTIKIDSNDNITKTFQSGGHTFYNMRVASTHTGSSSIEIVGSNTFNDFKINPGLWVTFDDNTTTTVTTFDANGTSGNNIILEATVGSNPFTITKSGGGTIMTSYMTITNSTATPSSTWFASNSIDGGGNTGRTFASTAHSNMFFMF